MTLRRFHKSSRKFFAMVDCVADDAVSGEPVCGANSLLTGKITGNFTKIGPFGETVPVKTPQNQLVAK